MTQMSLTPAVSYEVMMKRNKEEAEKLLKAANQLIAENRRISTEMQKVQVPSATVSVPSATADTLPASSRYSMVNGKGMSLPPGSIRPDPMGGLLHAADALVRSWQRRKKKNFKQLELDLITALERMNG